MDFIPYPRRQLHYTLITSFSGYRQDTMQIRLDGNIDGNCGDWLKNQLNWKTVVVSSKKRNENVVRPLTGVQKLSVSDIKNVPVIFGEKDVLKTIQLLPVLRQREKGTVVFMFGAEPQIRI